MCLNRLTLLASTVNSSLTAVAEGVADRTGPVAVVAGAGGAVAARPRLVDMVMVVSRLALVDVAWRAVVVGLVDIVGCFGRGGQQSCLCRLGKGGIAKPTWTVLFEPVLLMESAGVHRALVL